MTANGEIFNQNALTCAHKTLPFHTKLRVTLLETGKSVVVRVNDRGPFVGDRIIDLSVGAARRLGMIKMGTGEVEAKIVRLGDS
jgi:rare lipoprotein A